MYFKKRIWQILFRSKHDRDRVPYTQQFTDTKGGRVVIFLTLKVDVLFFFEKFERLVDKKFCIVRSDPEVALQFPCHDARPAKRELLMLQLSPPDGCGLAGDCSVW